jgi:hypothetical protein
MNNDDKISKTKKTNKPIIGEKHMTQYCHSGENNEYLGYIQTHNTSVFFDYTYRCFVFLALS